MPTDQIDFEIAAIQPGEKFAGFSLGDSKFTPLKTFAKKHAGNFEAKHLARTYCAGFDQETTTKGAKVISRKTVAYITLVCGEVSVEGYVVEPGYPYEHFPAVKIARLAVDANFRKFGLGRNLVEIAIGIAKDQICPAIGCRFVVVDSKQDAIKFYERCGFTLLDTDANRDKAEPVMFLDLWRLANGHGEGVPAP